MQSLENQVAGKIIGITGHSRIYFDSKTDEDFNLIYLEIKNYLSKETIDQLKKEIGISDS